MMQKRMQRANALKILLQAKPQYFDNADLRIKESFNKQKLVAYSLFGLCFVGLSFFKGRFLY